MTRNLLKIIAVLATLSLTLLTGCGLSEMTLAKYLNLKLNWQMLKHSAEDSSWRPKITPALRRLAITTTSTGWNTRKPSPATCWTDCRKIWWRRHPRLGMRRLHHGTAGRMLSRPTHRRG